MTLASAQTGAPRVRLGVGTVRLGVREVQARPPHRHPTRLDLISRAGVRNKPCMEISHVLEITARQDSYRRFASAVGGSHAHHEPTSIGSHAEDRAGVPSWLGDAHENGRVEVVEELDLPDLHSVKVTMPSVGRHGDTRSNHRSRRSLEERFTSTPQNQAQHVEAADVKPGVAEPRIEIALVSMGGQPVAHLRDDAEEVEVEVLRPQAAGAESLLPNELFERHGAGKSAARSTDRVNPIRILIGRSHDQLRVSVANLGRQPVVNEPRQFHSRQVDAGRVETPNEQVMALAITDQHLEDVRQVEYRQGITVAYVRKMSVETTEGELQMPQRVHALQRAMSYGPGLMSERRIGAPIAPDLAAARRISADRSLAEWADACHSAPVAGIDDREVRTGSDGFIWLLPPAPPWVYLGARFAGRLPDRFSVPAEYEVELPHRRGVPTGGRRFDVGRYFDDDTDLTRPFSALVQWATRASDRHGLKLRSVMVYGRVTDAAPGFGFVPTSKALAAFAAVDAWLDLSVYRA